MIIIIMKFNNCDYYNNDNNICNNDNINNNHYDNYGDDLIQK